MYKCKIDNRGFKTLNHLTRHLKNNYQMSSTEYTIKYTLNNEIPKCECGCGKDVKINGYKINRVYRGHSGGGTWQSKYDKDSDEYNEIVGKISKSVSKSTKGVKKSKEHAKNISLGQIKLNKEDLELKELKHKKMTATKRKQSKDGTLSKNHFVNNKSKDEVDEIYKIIGDKSSKTKQELFASGKLKVWNDGLNHNINPSIIHGKNHYRFNPNKKTEYSGIFYNKTYRKLILESQDGHCFNCESTEDLCLHHVDEVKTNNDFENLIFLCRSCHSKVHNDKNLQKIINFDIYKHKNEVISKLGDIQMSYLDNSSVIVDAID